MSIAVDYHDQLIFGLDLDEPQPQQPQHVPFTWDPYPDVDPDIKPSFNYYEYASAPALYPSLDDTQQHHVDELAAAWINDPDLASPSSPIPIPSPTDTNLSVSSFGFDQAPYSPIPFSPIFAPHQLPRSVSPPSTTSFDDIHQGSSRPRVHSVISPRDMALHTPSWAASLWDPPSASAIRTQPTLARPSVRHSPLSDAATIRQRNPRRGSLSSGMQLSSSAPTTAIETRLHPHHASSRPYTRRADSVSASEDRDATIRRKKRGDDDSAPSPVPKSTDAPTKSALRPPKLAPSAWQLYFTDWIQKQQVSGTRKLNVAQAAKEAGQEYACLSAAEKEPYKRRSQAMKEAREREHEAYMRTLTPEDIKRENLFRAAQRKAGKSRKSNIKDPNAPKKPLSAYFMFLQKIRSNPRLVTEIFGDETETTKQSVLAAAKWRSMTDAERQPFLAQAEHEKMEYEAARRLYEEGTTGFGSSINFSILPGSLDFPLIKTESESESEGFITDDASERRSQSRS